MRRLNLQSCVLLAALACGSPLARAEYVVKRLASGFHLPVYATTAPGDDDRIFVVQLGGLASHETDSDPNTSVDGKIMIYNRSTGTVNTTPFLVIPDTDESEVVPAEPEVGLWGLTFHPDFQSNGKFYVNVAVENTNPSSVFAITLREYAASVDPDIANPTPTRTLLSLDKPDGAEANHNGSWIGFNPIPNAANDNKKYLYITLGDGGGQHDPGNDAQSLTSLYGKTLRIDPDGADAFPGNANKNYAIPPSNPFVGVPGEDEIWNYGLRNPWQAHFDRQTGDFWIGDVGQGAREEIDFQPAASDGGENYQWRLREGSIATPSGGVGGAAPPGSVGPVYDYPHFGQGTPGFEGLSVAGGVVYRGPVTELQGKHIFGDSRSGEVWSFDPADPYGTVARMKQLPEFTPDEGVIDYVVSFGEDNHGNLLIVDYDGELFQVFPTTDLMLTVDRVTGQMSWQKPAGSSVDITAYSISSPSGAIDPDHVIPITGNYDAPPSGDGSLDPNSAWQIISPTGSHTSFAEESTGDAGTFPAGSMFDAGDAGAWIRSIYEDLQIEVALSDGSRTVADVQFVGNGNQPFDRSDLNFNGALDPADWPLFRSRHLESFEGLSLAQSYQLGDLDGDGDNDFADFRLFRADYTAANGAAAFAALVDVPEPCTIMLLAAYATLAPLVYRRRAAQDASAARRSMMNWCPWRRAARLSSFAVIVAFLCACTASTQAALTHRYTFNYGSASDSIGNADGVLLGGANVSNGVLNLPGGSGDFVSLLSSGTGGININTYVDATFEAWFTTTNNTSARTWQRVFDFGASDGAQGSDYIFYTPRASGTNARAAIRDGLEAENAANHPTLSANTPYHIAIVVDDNANGGVNRMTIYQNGLVSGSGVALTHSLSELSNNLALLGESLFPVDANFIGTLDEFRIHNNALSAANVQASFNAGPTPANLLRLEVHMITGRATITNIDPSVPLDIDYYRIASASGALDTTKWNSLSDQNVDAVGAGEGESWDEADQSSDTELAELFLLGDSPVTLGNSLQIGHLFDPSVFGPGIPGDLEFQFGVAGEGLTTGIIDYVTPLPLDGDYDDNGVVEAADYVVWRNSFGSTTDLAADGDGDGRVDEYDFTIWKMTFGNTASGTGAALAAVPESASGLLVVTGGLACASLLTRRIR